MVGNAFAQHSETRMADTASQRLGMVVAPADSQVSVDNPATPKRALAAGSAILRKNMLPGSAIGCTVREYGKVSPPPLPQVAAGNIASRPYNQTQTPVRRVLAISSRIEQCSHLADAAAWGVDVLRFDWSSANLHELLAALQKAAAIDNSGRSPASIALAVPGKPGVVSLLKGCRTTLETLNRPGVQSFWKGVGELVEIGGTIDLLMCRVAHSTDGQALVAELARLSSTNIFAFVPESEDSSSFATPGEVLDSYVSQPELVKYFEHTKMERWFKTAMEHAQVQARKRSKWEKSELRRVAHTAECQIAEAQQAITAATKNAEERIQVETQARTRAEQQLQLVQKQYNEETQRRTIADEENVRRRLQAKQQAKKLDTL
jgi:hypothetical protein